MRRRLLSTFYAFGLVAALGLLSGCRSKPPAGAPALEPGPWTWHPKSEDAKHRLEGFRAYLRRTYPALGLESKDELWNTALEYTQWLGLEVDSQAGTAQLEDTLSSLVPAPNDIATHWLLKATLRTPTPQAPPSQCALYGLAGLSQTADSLALEMQSNRGGITFSGSVKGHRLNGRLAVVCGSTRWFGKARGTVAPGRLSLQARGRSGKQPVEVDVVLLR